MSENNIIECVCPKCGASGHIEKHSSINVKETPALRPAVLDGSLQRWVCPVCGEICYRTYPVLYHDPDRKFMVWLLPKEEIDASIVEYGRKISEMLPEYRCRRVDNILRLAEKIQIFEQGASDVVVELSEFVFRQEMASKYKDDEERLKQIYASNIFFHGIKFNGGECEEFRISVVDEKGEFAYFSIAPHIYSDCAAILSRNPQLDPEPGFETVDAFWIISRIS